MERNLDTSVLWDITHGLYIVSSFDDGRFNGQIVDALMQVSAKPPKIAVALNKNNLTHEFIQKSGSFSVSILSEDAPMEMIQHFGLRTGRDVEKFTDVPHETGLLGCPIVPGHSLGCMEAKLENILDVGSHSIFVAEVVSSKRIGGGKPLTYGEYRSRKMGGAPAVVLTTSESHPPNTHTPHPPNIQTPHTNIDDTDIDDTKDKEEKNMAKDDKYECEPCGYIYDPAKGDPDGDIAPGTAFEDIPDTWVCPLCGVDKTFFRKL